MKKTLKIFMLAFGINLLENLILALILDVPIQENIVILLLTSGLLAFAIDKFVDFKNE